MSTGLVLRCHDCNMTFQSASLLNKHKSKFCVGAPLDPRSLKGRYSADFHQQPVRRITPDDRPVSDGYFEAGKLSELQQWKYRRAHEKWQRDNDEKTLVRSFLPEEDDRISRASDRSEDLWQERSHALRTQFDRKPGQGYPRVTTESSLSLTSNSSMSIHLPDDEDERRHPVRDSRHHQLRVQVDQHGRNLADIQSKHRSLQHERDEINRRLEMLNRTAPVQQVVQQPDYVSDLIRELREQERRNQQTLQELKEQMLNMQGSARPGSPNTLLTQISIMRKEYLRKGGNNAELLSQMAQMEADALASQSKFKRGKQKGKYDSLNEQILAFELENQRLAKELDDLHQSKRSHARQEENASLHRELQKMQNNHVKKLTELQQEMELLKQQTKIEKYKREMAEQAARNPPPLPPPPQIDQPQIDPYRYQQQQQQPQYDPYISLEPLLPAPYDYNEGFTVFYDYVSGLDHSVQTCRLAVGLFNSEKQYGTPTLLPLSNCEPSQGGYLPLGTNSAKLNAKQPVPRCRARRDLSLVIELQLAYGHNPYNTSRMTTRAWTKIQVFDSKLRLLSGRWRLPLKVTPIRPDISSFDLETVPQHGMSEVFIRLVNARDAEAQSMVPLSANVLHQYRFPPQDTKQYKSNVHSFVEKWRKATKNQFQYMLKAVNPDPRPPHIPPPPETTPPQTPDLYAQYSPHYRGYDQDFNDVSSTLGFQVDRVKHADPGEGKIRITAYYQSSGNVVGASPNMVSCSTTTVKSSYKQGYHVFGQQEASFSDVKMRDDMLVVVRFYLRQRSERAFEDMKVLVPEELKMSDDETLVAWATLPLMVNGAKLDDYAGKKQKTDLKLNTGTHTLKLYQPPVPEISQIPIEEHFQPKSWRPYGKANVRIHIFENKPRPGSLTPSVQSQADYDDNTPEQAWLSHERSNMPTEPYKATDGFDLYIDGCRCLPDTVTISRVAARILDRKYNKVGKDVNGVIDLESDIYNPDYNIRTEFREPNLPPTATILIKVYSIDKLSGQLTVFGIATLNLFVETGSERQPSIDSGGVQISLNEGGHQLRLYQKAPNGAYPLTESCLFDNKVAHIPCSSILVRLVKAPLSSRGKPLEAEKIPQADWGRMGLWQARPRYRDRAYYSMKCVPTRSEKRLYLQQIRRTHVSVREAVATTIPAEEAQALRTDDALEEYIRERLTKSMDVLPVNLDLSLVAKYDTKAGIKFALDSALNLPWSSFSHATFCLNPPGAFYLANQAPYDKLTFTEKLEQHCSNKSPVWEDGYKQFRDRAFHRYLTMIIHLQEIQVTTAQDTHKYALVEQAWTAIQIFTSEYANCGIYQLPLFQGGPTKQILAEISREPLLNWMDRAVRSGKVSYADYSSIFVRLADGRRGEELSIDYIKGEHADIRSDYMPDNDQEKEKFATQGNNPTPILDLVPPGKLANDFIPALATKFKSLVYKLSEEGKMAT